MDGAGARNSSAPARKSWLSPRFAGRGRGKYPGMEHQKGEYLAAPDFWNRTLQNWQSEFLAILSMALLSIYLRQRGSPESKPVGAAHSATGVEG